MTTRTLADKLLIKPDYRLLIMRAPAGYVSVLGKLPEGVTVAHEPGGDQFDFVQIFVKTVKDIEALAPVAVRALKPAGLFWVCYPKLSSKVASDITRDRGWQAIEQAGFEGVALVSVDEVWSALRFRPADQVGKRRRK